MRDYSKRGCRKGSSISLNCVGTRNTGTRRRAGHGAQGQGSRRVLLLNCFLWKDFCNSQVSKSAFLHDDFHFLFLSRRVDQLIITSCWVNVYVGVWVFRYTVCFFFQTVSKLVASLIASPSPDSFQLIRVFLKVSYLDFDTLFNCELIY